MNQRERILAITVLGVIILGVGGVLFNWLFLGNLNRINADIASTKADIAKKEDEERKEEDDQNTLRRNDPRLAQWKALSLPEDPGAADALKAGRSADDVKKRHEDRVQGDYDRFLNDLMVKSGFQPGSIKVSPAGADKKGGPVLSGKTPAYSRMTFTVQAQGGLEAVQRMMEEFYKTPLLHQVRNLTLTSRPQNAAPRGPGGAAGTPAGPGIGRPGGAFRASASGGGDLDVTLTVEALLVAGAQKRDTLLPKASDLKPLHTLAYDDHPSDTNGPHERDYSDMLAKNMFTGIASKAVLSEDRDQVLSTVRLTAIWNDGRRWQATIFDPNKAPDRQTGEREMKVRPPIVDEFSIVDAYGNVLLRAKALKLDGDGLIFQADGKVYRWRCGEYLGKRSASVASTAADEEPQYIPGVLDNALKADELKTMGITPPTTARGD